jgi:23S rRNA (uracil1939-C5)-methyltransferase
MSDQSTTSESEAITGQVVSLAFGGSGLVEIVEGPQDLIGMKGFVPFVVPGERISLAIEEKKERFFEGKLLTVLDADPRRVKPPCAHFGVCGGCDYQHIQYDAQLDLKRTMVSDVLYSAGCGNAVLERLRSIVPSSPYAYRRRVTLHLAPDGAVGFYKRGSRSIEPLRECHIVTPSLRAVLPKIREFCEAIRGQSGTLLLESGKQEAIVILKVERNTLVGSEENLLRTLQQYFPAGALFMDGKELSSFGDAVLSLPFGSQELEVPAGSFSQVNWEVNEKLVGRVVEVARKFGGKLAHDLYAGAGNFSIPLAREGWTALAVESDRRLVGIGDTFARKVGIGDRVSFINLSVEKFFSEYPQSRVPNLVIADPPRSGLGHQAKRVAMADTLILISCYLPSGARDIKNLTGLGWEVEYIEPFDMFAQTTYLELMTVFRRR